MQIIHNWHSNKEFPKKEGEYLVKIKKRYFIGYFYEDGKWGVSGIESNIDKWKILDDTEWQLR